MNEHYNRAADLAANDAQADSPDERSIPHYLQALTLAVLALVDEMREFPR